MDAVTFEDGLDPEDFPPYGAPKIAGDPHDDDGRVIDDFFVEVDNPPEKISDTPAVHHDTPARRVSQLLSGFQVIDLNNLNTPVRLLTADPDRKNVFVRVNGTVVTDAIRLADDQNKLAYPGAGGTSGIAGKVFVNGVWNSDSHTGAIWVIGTDITAPVTVSYWAVTD